MENEDLQIKNQEKLPFLDFTKRPWMFLAPMVANSEEAYRSLARRYGADLCYTEMVHCKTYNNSKANPVANAWYTTSPEDRPLVVQICGNDPETMLKTCLAVQGFCDAIDINFGCPQEIARKGHYGSFLMDDLPLVENIVRRLSANISVPLFCKIRIFESMEKTLEYAKMLERSGCALLVVHGRQRAQKGQETGYASWEHIKAVKSSLSIPVISNGGVICHEMIKKCLDYTSCDGIMIAEPHLYDPTIFLPQKFTSVCVFEEYLQIILETPKSARFKHVKSHAFKMFRKVLLARPDLIPILDGCKSIPQFSGFVEILKLELAEGRLNTADLELGPYIRKEYINSAKADL